MTPDQNQRIDYQASFETDLLEKSGQTGWEPVTNTLGRQRASPKGGYQLVFHANIKVTPMLDGVQAFGQFRMLRIQRIWVAQLTGPAPIVGPLKLQKQPRDALLPAGFFSDSNLDGFGDPLGHWIDAPFQTYDGGKNLNERLVREFVVGVGDANKQRTPFPGFGGLHFIVVIDVVPDRYRMFVSMEKRLSGADIQGVYHAPGFASPPALANLSPPDVSSFRLNVLDWQSYKDALK